MLNLGLNLTSNIVRDAATIGGSSYRDGVANAYSLAFDGLNDSVTLGDFPALGDAFTISLWTKWDSLPSAGDYDNLISFGGASAELETFVIGRHAVADVLHRLYVWAGSNTYLATPVVSTGSWYNIIVVVKPTSGRLAFYVNGVSETIEQPSADWDIGSTSDGMLGRWHSGAYSYMAGYIDEVAVFDTNLTADDAEDIYNGGTPTDLAQSASYDTDRTGDLVRYWRMTEGTGSWVANSAGTGAYSGSLSSTTWSSEAAPN